MKLGWGVTVMITTVFFICDYRPRHGPQAQYKMWMYITGLYDLTTSILIP